MGLLCFITNLGMGGGYSVNPPVRAASIDWHVAGPKATDSHVAGVKEQDSHVAGVEAQQGREQ